MKPIRDILPRVRGDCMWTDEDLALKQHAHQQNAVGLAGDVRARDACLADLYRLARLGLAAERTGWATFSAATFAFGEFCAPGQGREARVSLDAFLNHPAWHK